MLKTSMSHNYSLSTTITALKLTKMMKTLFARGGSFMVLLISIILVGQVAQAQITSTRKDTAKKARYELPDSIVERKLVELALSSPSSEAAKHQNKISEYQLKTAKSAWLNILSLSANYNDQTFAKQNPNNQVVYPKFFAGINIPLGVLFSRSPVKAAQEQIAIGKINEEIIARSLKVEILSKYKQYKTIDQLITHQQEVVDDYKAGLLQAEKKFSNGEITIEAYNSSSRNHNDELAKLLNLRLQQDIIRLEIERIIGTSLDTVMY
jgi:outer membrane protein TolC